MTANETTTSHTLGPKVTVGIKALNEETQIAATIISALEAVRPLDGEVVLADSGSTDRTMEIARGFPIRIVQLADPADRSCGAGAQLAFQVSRGEYFYILDGDMIIHAPFLQQAVAVLDRDPSLAGVGGRIAEMNTEGHGFAIRAKAMSDDGQWQPGHVDRLDCGGLYRTAAVRDVVYFADRNLRAFEEFDLAARLRSHGWKLLRVDIPAADHFGHKTGGYRLLWRRLMSGYASGAGQVLRSSVGQKHFLIVLKSLRHIRHSIVVIAWWLGLVAVPSSVGYPLNSLRMSGVVALTWLLLPPLYLAIRRRSLKLGLYSFAAWNLGALGLLLGIFRRRVDPRKPLNVKEEWSPDV